MESLLCVSCQALAWLTALAACFYAFMRYQHSYWSRMGIPTAPGSHWFFGHLKDGFLMRKSPALMMGDIYRSGGENDDVLGMYILHKPFLLIRNPQIVKNILVRDFANFPNHHFSADSLRDRAASKNLFSLKNPEWKYLRVKMAPSFTSGKLKRLFLLMVETSDSLKCYLEQEFAGGKKTVPIPVVEAASKFTTNIISTVAFGLKTNSFVKPAEFFEKSRDSTKLTIMQGVRLFCMFFFPDFVKYLGTRILGPSSDYFRSVFTQSLKAREESGMKRGDILDSLVDLKNQPEDTAFKFDNDVLFAQSAIFFIAGRQTSSTTAVYTLFEMAKQPDLQKKLREEIQEKLNQHGFTYEAVQEMKYLFQVISETLRMYPPAPLIDRTPLTDYKVPGTDIVIEKGTPVYIALHGLHFDARYHPHPNTYDPERFSEKRKEDIEPCTYMPFGDGPRVCIGMRVGLLQTATALITIFKDFEVSLHKDHACAIDPRNVFTTPPPDFRLNFTRLAKSE